MRRLYFDTGTSNSRGYLLEGDHLVGQAALPVGSRHSSMAGSSRPMLEALEKLYTDLCEGHGLKANPPGEIYLSGMITSRYGLRDVEHLTLPVDLQALRRGICYIQEDQIFHRRVGLIPGLKTAAPPGTGFACVQERGNLRGEEIQAFGLLDLLGRPQERLALILPGSHTQVLFVQDCSIVDLLSTVSGELYHAVAQESVLAGSLSHAGALPPRAVAEGCRLLHQYGLNRALYMLHASHLFHAVDNDERTGALNGILEGGVLDALEERMCSSGWQPQRIVVAGKERMCRVYRVLLEAAGWDIPWQLLPEDPALPLSLRGLLAMMKAKEAADA